MGHWEIVIGDDIQTGPYVYITDQNHTYLDPVEPIGRQWPTEAPVRIGSGSWLGANAVILPGAQIGEHVVVAARRGGARRDPGPLRRRRGAGPRRAALGRGIGVGRREGPHPVVSAANVAPSSLLVTVRGQDAPGIAQRLFAVLGARGVAVDDVEQIRVHGRLLLLRRGPIGSDGANEDDEARAALTDALTEALAGAGVDVAVDPLVESDGGARGPTGTW